VICNGKEKVGDLNLCFKNKKRGAFIASLFLVAAKLLIAKL
jgi:hypothetical protein